MTIHVKREEVMLRCYFASINLNNKERTPSNEMCVYFYFAVDGGILF